MNGIIFRLRGCLIVESHRIAMNRLLNVAKVIKHHVFNKKFITLLSVMCAKRFRVYVFKCSWLCTRKNCQLCSWQHRLCSRNSSAGCTLDCARGDQIGQPCALVNYKCQQVSSLPSGRMLPFPQVKLLITHPLSRTVISQHRR